MRSKGSEKRAVLAEALNQECDVLIEVDTQKERARQPHHSSVVWNGPCLKELCNVCLKACCVGAGSLSYWPAQAVWVRRRCNVIMQALKIRTPVTLSPATMHVYHPLKSKVYHHDQQCESSITVLRFECSISTTLYQKHAKCLRWAMSITHC